MGGGGWRGEGRGEIRDGQDRDGEGSNHADLYTQIDILHTYSQIERQTDILHAYTQIDRHTVHSKYIHRDRQIEIIHTYNQIDRQTFSKHTRR